MENSIEARIQAYLRKAASNGRDTEQIGPFLATISPHSDNPYVNYAIPDDNAVPTSEDVLNLIAAYERRDRTPRLEYITGLAPAVEDALIENGFVTESLTPLLICTSGEERDQVCPSGFELVLPTTEDELHGMLSSQNEAFGEGEPSRGDIVRLRSNIESGTIAVLARDFATGDIVGGGVCTAPVMNITEVAGIGVREAYRRCGIAAALTTRLTREAFASDVTLAFMMAGGESQTRIYTRAGYREISKTLHISRPKS